MKKHAAKYTSIDLTYEILGSAEFVDEMSVVMVRTVVTPKPTRAGVAPRFSQKETQDITTMREEGM